LLILFYFNLIIAPIMGSFALQIAFISVYINKFYFEYVNEERLFKLMEAIVPKSSIFYIGLRREDFEYFKQLDPLIENIDDITKVEENIWVNN
jgi:hypothetical protein